MLSKIEPNLESIVEAVFGEGIPKVVLDWVVGLLVPMEMTLRSIVMTHDDCSPEEVRALLVLRMGADIHREIDLATCSESAIAEKEKELLSVPY